MATDQVDPRGPSSSDSVERAADAVRRFSRAMWLNLVRRDQSERWQSGSGVPAERYFELLPELRDDQEDALVLVCGEARARREAGQLVSLGDFERRFPELAAELAIQFELDETFGNLSGNVDDEHHEFRLPGFEILHEIGRGASAVVYLSRQNSVDRLVAVKVMRAWSADESYLRRHRHEASTLSRMKHPNVVQIYDVIESDDALCSVIEYVDGPTLAEHTGGRPQPPAEAARLMRLLADIVHAVHEAGILHRDLKPSNVLLTSRGEPKISDFGLAKLVTGSSQVTTHHGLLGTPSYMPPELAADDGQGAGREGDVYSLGAILYELLTGHPPFLGVTVLDTLSMIRERDPIMPRSFEPGIPRDLETICLKCLAKSPRERYATASALADDLGRFLSGESIVARRASRRERAARWCRRNPLVAALAAGLLLAVAIGFAGVVWQWRQAERARRNESLARIDADAHAHDTSLALQRLKLANGFLERGHAFLDSREWDTADAAFTRAIELRPDHVQAWTTRGESLYMPLGLWDLAAVDLARAFELQRPNTPRRWLWNALLRMHVQDTNGYQQLCDEMRKLVGRHRNSGFTDGFVRVRALAPIGADEAHSVLESANEIASYTPQAAAVRYGQALACLRSKRYEQAIEHCRASLNGQAGSFCKELNYPVMAIAYAALGSSDDARLQLDLAERSLKAWTEQRCQPGSDHWVISLGSSVDWPISCWHWLEFMIYLREARTALKLATANPDPWSHVLRARAFAGLRRIDKADEEYTIALKLMPDNHQVQLETHRNRAYYAARLRQFDRAAEEFAVACKISPDDSRLLSYQALARCAAGDHQGYRATCAKLIQQFGKTTDGAQASDVVTACVLTFDALDDTAQLVPLGRLTTTRYVGSIRLLGITHYRAGQFEEALACFEQGSRIAEARPWELLFEAMTRHRLGQTEQARNCLAAAVEWVDRANHPDPDDLTGLQPAWGGWYEKVQVPITMREVESLIGPPVSAAVTRAFP